MYFRVVLKFSSAIINSPNGLRAVGSKVKHAESDINQSLIKRSYDRPIKCWRSMKREPLLRERTPKWDNYDENQVTFPLGSLVETRTSLQWESCPFMGGRMSSKISKARMVSLVRTDGWLEIIKPFFPGIFRAISNANLVTLGA